MSDSPTVFDFTLTSRLLDFPYTREVSNFFIRRLEHKHCTIEVHLPLSFLTADIHFDGLEVRVTPELDQRKIRELQKYAGMHGWTHQTLFFSEDVTDPVAKAHDAVLRSAEHYRNSLLPVAGRLAKLRNLTQRYVDQYAALYDAADNNDVVAFERIYHHQLAHTDRLFSLLQTPYLDELEGCDTTPIRFYVQFPTGFDLALAYADLYYFRCLDTVEGYVNAGRAKQQITSLEEDRRSAIVDFLMENLHDLPVVNRQEVLYA